MSKKRNERFCVESTRTIQALRIEAIEMKSFLVSLTYWNEAPEHCRKKLGESKICAKAKELFAFMSQKH